MRRRQIFQWFTALLLVVCVWTAYANVLSDDTDVRAMARTFIVEFEQVGYVPSGDHWREVEGTETATETRWVGVRQIGWGSRL